MLPYSGNIPFVLTADCCCCFFLLFLALRVFATAEA